MATSDVRRVSIITLTSDVVQFSRLKHTRTTQRGVAEKSCDTQEGYCKACLMRSYGEGEIRVGVACGCG